MVLFTHATLIAVLTLGLGQGAAHDPVWSQFQRVDPGSVDVEPLSADQRAVTSVDLREPQGFNDLYMLPSQTVRRQGSPAGERVFARRAGGVTALFPRSTYETSRYGTHATIPPGTVFVIGEPDERVLAQFGVRPLSQTPPRRSPYALSYAIDPSLPPPSLAVQPRQPEPEMPTSLFLNEQYRQRRVTELVLLASRVARSAD